MESVNSVSALLSADWVWVQEGNRWHICWTTLPPIEESCQQLTKCGCKTECCGRCKWCRFGLTCMANVQMSGLIQITIICGEIQRQIWYSTCFSNKFTITNFASNFPPFILKYARQKLLTTFRVVNSTSKTYHNWTPRLLNLDSFVKFPNSTSVFAI